MTRDGGKQRESLRYYMCIICEKEGRSNFVSSCIKYRKNCLKKRFVFHRKCIHVYIVHGSRSLETLDSRLKTDGYSAVTRFKATRV